MLAATNDQLPEAEINALVATLLAIVDKIVLRRPIGEPGVMQRQLQHLRAYAHRPNVTLRAMSFSAGATPGLDRPIVIIDLADGRSVVHFEARRAGAFLSEEPTSGRVGLPCVSFLP